MLKREKGANENAVQTRTQTSQGKLTTFGEPDQIFSRVDIFYYLNVNIHGCT